LEIKVGDYIEGYEYYGKTVKKVRGWVAHISSTWKNNLSYDIQADDGWKGARGTTICSELGEVAKLEMKTSPIRRR